MTDTDKFDSQMKRGTLEMLLLCLVADGKSYGYELVSQLDERSGGLVDVKEGTLYPVLYRLEDAGFITAEWDTPERGAPRKYYSITSSGRKRLDQLISNWEQWIHAVARTMKGDSGKETT